MTTPSKNDSHSQSGLTGRHISLLASWAGAIKINKIKFTFDYDSGQLIHSQKRPVFFTSKNKRSKTVMEKLKTERLLISHNLTGKFIHECKLTLPAHSLEVYHDQVFPHFQQEMSQGEWCLLEDGRTFYSFTVGEELGERLEEALKRASNILFPKN